MVRCIIRRKYNYKWVLESGINLYLCHYYLKYTIEMTQFPIWSINQFVIKSHTNLTQIPSLIIKLTI